MKNYVLFFSAVLIGFQSNVAYSQAVVPSYGQPRYVDFSYGFPVYYGDFWKAGGGATVYRGTALASSQQYNTTSISAGAMLPFRGGLFIRPQLSNTTFYFQDPIGRVFFRNNVFEIGLSASYLFVWRRFGAYAYAGPGMSISYKTDIFLQQADAEQTPLSKRTSRLSFHSGLGLQFMVWRQINLFGEYHFLFSGSDQLDGHNGDEQTPSGFVEASAEKSYFQRDKIGAFRIGIRLPITRPPSRIEERPKEFPLSTIDPDPGFDEVTSNEKAVSFSGPKNKPALYYKLNVQQKLRLYTIAVTHALTLEELEQYNSSAVRIATTLKSPGKKVEVQLLETSSGYTVHFGTFSSTAEARKFSRRLSDYYRDIQIIYHGK